MDIDVDIAIGIDNLLGHSTGMCGYYSPSSVKQSMIKYNIR